MFYEYLKCHNCRNDETFRIYVNMPLMPGFEGQLGATGASALQAVMYWTFQSISNGPNSLYHHLKQRGSMFLFH
jgi:hypothetical protein